jgi:hypothetical protein
MSRRQMYIGIAGVLLVLIGLGAMWLPVYLNQFDDFGIQIRCGNGFSSSLTQATGSNGGNVASQCDTALLERRAWAIPAVVIGWLLLIEFLMFWVRSSETGGRSGEIEGSAQQLESAAR